MGHRGQPPVDAPRARELIESPTATVWVSAASVWEIAIKHGLGRGDMPVSGAQALRWFRESGYRLLPIEPEHAAAVEELPAHHQDPFAASSWPRRWWSRCGC